MLVTYIPSLRPSESWHGTQALDRGVHHALCTIRSRIAVNRRSSIALNACPGSLGAFRVSSCSQLHHIGRVGVAAIAKFCSRRSYSTTGKIKTRLRLYDIANTTKLAHHFSPRQWISATRARAVPKFGTTSTTRGSHQLIDSHQVGMDGWEGLLTLMVCIVVNRAAPVPNIIITQSMKICFFVFATALR